MNDMELAEEIERHLTKAPISRMAISYEPKIWQQIIAALRRADLAQTEIKGHMRNESDLLNELALARADWASAQTRIAELEKDWETDADYIRMAERVKELEKDAARYRWLRDCTDLNRPIAIFFDSTKYGSEVNTPEATDAAIDAALKSRA